MKGGKSYHGRLPDGLASEIERFSESVSFDYRLAPYDIKGSIAHCRMLGKTGIIPNNEADQIIAGLKRIAEQIENGEFQFDVANEDVHMNIERALTELIGEVGGKLHTSRSRNDQVALDIRLYLRAKIDEIDELIAEFGQTLVRLAEDNIELILPGYTHLQRAQPVLLAHHLLAYEQMLRRDRGRLADARRRVNVCPLGAAALAGTGFPIDREMVALELGFVDDQGRAAICANSIDAVADRDFAVEFLAACAIAMTHLSRLAEEVILWTSGEFAFAELDDRHSTGSSIMPQKKNPDVFELTRGKTGRVYGDLLSLLTILKGTPLAYNRDLQEDKPPIFDAVETLSITLIAVSAAMAAIKFNPEAMIAAARGGYSTATELADYLAGKGTPFRQAHGFAAEAVRAAIKSRRFLDELTIEELRAINENFDEDVIPRLRVEYAVASRESAGGTGPKAVAGALAEAKKYWGA